MAAATVPPLRRSCRQDRDRAADIPWAHDVGAVGHRRRHAASVRRQHSSGIGEARRRARPGDNSRTRSQVLARLQVELETEVAPFGRRGPPSATAAPDQRTNVPSPRVPTPRLASPARVGPAPVVGRPDRATARTRGAVDRVDPAEDHGPSVVARAGEGVAALDDAVVGDPTAVPDQRAVLVVAPGTQRPSGVTVYRRRTRAARRRSPGRPSPESTSRRDPPSVRRARRDGRRR